MAPQNDDAEHGARDHDDHHDGGQIIAGLLEHLNGHGASEDQVDHHDSDPAVEIEVDRELHANGEHGNHEHDAGNELLGTREVEFIASPAEKPSRRT